MNRLFDSIFNIQSFATVAERNRVRLLIGTTLLLFTFYTIFLFLIPVVTIDPQTTGQTIGSQFGQDNFITLSISTFYPLFILTLVLIRAKRYDVARWSPPILWLFSVMVLAFSVGFRDPDGGAQTIVLVLLAAIFARTIGILIFTPLALVVLFTGFLRYRQIAVNANTYSATFDDMIALSFVLVGISVMLYFFLRNLLSQEKEAVSTVIEDRQRLAELTTQISTSVLRRSDLDATLTSAVEEIRVNFPLAYHVQIFLIDETRRSARLAASTGDVGRILMERGHSLPVGSTSVIGRVTSQGDIVVARSGSTETVHKRNEFLPETVVEAAFPLRSGDIVIGALDLQSKLTDAFTESELPIFQALADNVAIAIDNARLLEAAEVRVRENQQLTEQMRLSLREIERLNAQMTAQSWSDYVAQVVQPNMTLDLATENVNKRAEWTATLNEAAATNQIVQRELGDALVLAIPIAVRTQVIGAFEFEFENEEPLDAEDMQMLMTISERLGLALESSRLFDESRRTAQRETVVNEIGSRLVASNSISGVLNEAARSIQESLGAHRVAIRLGTPPKPNGHDGGRS